MSVELAPAPRDLELSYPSKPDSDRTDTPAPRKAGWPLAAFGSGASAVVIATVYAVASGANIAIALLVGYTSLACTAALAWIAAQPRPPQQTRTDAVAQSGIDTSAAWRLVNTFTVSDASRLWCGIEPGATATQESMAWARALQDAISQGDLAIVAKPGTSEDEIKRETAHPHYMTQLTRDALKAWATRHGHAPAFLRD